ncbi:MAG: hypothetical protein OHK0022_07050 [Roseiflexaceae bacterium]
MADSIGLFISGCSYTNEKMDVANTIPAIAVMAAKPILITNNPFPSHLGQEFEIQWRITRPITSETMTVTTNIRVNGGNGEK